jgi:hypothetical protein
MSDITMKERYPVSVNLLYGMSQIIPQTKAAGKSDPSLCTAFK